MSFGKSAEKQGDFKVPATNFMSKRPVKHTLPLNHTRGRHDVKMTQSKLKDVSFIYIDLIKKHGSNLLCSARRISNNPSHKET